MKKQALFYFLFFLFSAGDSLAQFYQCPTFFIPPNQMPYTTCTFHVHLNPTPHTFWNQQVRYGFNHVYNACESARVFAWQTCQQANFSWYGGRAMCLNQYYQCQSYIPAPY